MTFLRKYWENIIDRYLNIFFNILEMSYITLYITGTLGSSSRKPRLKFRHVRRPLEVLMLLLLHHIKNERLVFRSSNAANASSYSEYVAQNTRNNLRRSNSAPKYPKSYGFERRYRTSLCKWEIFQVLI